MDVLVSAEHRFERAPDGSVWTQTMFPRSFWQRYLDVFDGVRILARVLPVNEIPTDSLRVDGDGVELIEVPHYIGPLQYARRRRRVRRAVLGALSAERAVILRVSSQIANCLAPALYRSGQPFGTEVVADPHDVFSPKAVRHVLRPWFRRQFARQLRDQCQAACATAYVTEHALQRRYPPSAESFTTHYSSVELPREAFRSEPRTDFTHHPLQIVFVGTLSQMYKGVDDLIDALAVCLGNGLRLHLTVIGDGQHRSQLEAQARSSGCGTSVSFLGQLSAGEAVRNQLDQADLFVLPSRQEGLPRAMIEAMARGLPCIGSDVGGIPELLSPQDIVPTGDVAALAHKIREVVDTPGRLASMSRRTLERAESFREETLRRRRRDFYEAVRGATSRWQSNTQRQAPRAVSPDSHQHPSRTTPETILQPVGDTSCATSVGQNTGASSNVTP